MSDLLPHRCYLSKSNHLMYGFLVSVIGLFAYDYESSLWNDDNDPFDSYHSLSAIRNFSCSKKFPIKRFKKEIKYLLSKMDSHSNWEQLKVKTIEKQRHR